MATAITDLQRPLSAAAAPAVGWHSFRAEMDRLSGSLAGRFGSHGADPASLASCLPAIDGLPAADRHTRAFDAPA